MRSADKTRQPDTGCGVLFICANLPPQLAARGNMGGGRGVSLASPSVLSAVAKRCLGSSVNLPLLPGQRQRGKKVEPFFSFPNMDVRSNAEQHFCMEQGTAHLAENCRASVSVGIQGRQRVPAAAGAACGQAVSFPPGAAAFL